MGDSSTVIVNNTQRELDIQVGNHQYFVHFASLPKGEKHKLRVGYSDTYQEFLMGVDKSGKKLIVTSDDCCDYKCITISEVDGKFDVQREPRRHFSHADDSSTADNAQPSAIASKKPTRSSWRFWKSS